MQTRHHIINPFANKGRIVTGKDFIGRFEGLKTFASKVTDLPMPNNLAIIGYPRIGKSSLANQAIIQKRECLAEENKIVIWTDFSSFSSREAFFKYLVRYSFDNLKRFSKIDDEIKAAASQGYSILKKLDKNNTTYCIAYYKFINMYVLLLRFG